MALIKTITGVTKASVDFRKNVTAIQVIMTDSLGALDINAPKMIAYISSTKRSKRVTFFETSNMIDVAEVATLYKDRRITLNQGTNLTVDTSAPNPNAPLIFAAKLFASRFQLDFTDGNHGIQIDGTDDIILELSDLVATTTYEIHSVEVDGNGNDSDLLCYKYDVLSTKQEHNAKFLCDGKIERFAVEKGLGFDSIEVGYKDGSNVKLSPQDLDLQSNDSFGDCYETNSILLGAGFNVLPVTFIESAPRRNYVIPLHGGEAYMQVNVLQVAGVVPSLRVIAVSEQHLH